MAEPPSRDAGAAAEQSADSDTTRAAQIFEEQKGLTLRFCELMEPFTFDVLFEQLTALERSLDPSIAKEVSEGHTWARQRLAMLEHDPTVSYQNITDEERVKAAIRAMKPEKLPKGEPPVSVTTRPSPVPSPAQPLQPSGVIPPVGKGPLPQDFSSHADDNKLYLSNGLYWVNYLGKAYRVGFGTDHVIRDVATNAEVGRCTPQGVCSFTMQEAMDYRVLLDEYRDAMNNLEKGCELRGQKMTENRVLSEDILQQEPEILVCLAAMSRAYQEGHSAAALSDNMRKKLQKKLLVPAGKLVVIAQRLKADADNHLRACPVLIEASRLDALFIRRLLSCVRRIGEAAPTIFTPVLNEAFVRIRRGQEDDFRVLGIAAPAELVKHLDSSAMRQNRFEAEIATVEDRQDLAEKTSKLAYLAKKLRDAIDKNWIDYTKDTLNTAVPVQVIGEDMFIEKAQSLAETINKIFSAIFKIEQQLLTEITTDNHAIQCIDESLRAFTMKVMPGRKK